MGRVLLSVSVGITCIGMTCLSGFWLNAQAQPMPDETAIAFAGITGIQVRPISRNAISVEFLADFPFQYRIKVLDDDRVAIRLIHGKVSDRLKGPALNQSYDLLNVPASKLVERITLLKPFPGSPENQPIEEIQFHGKNIGKKRLIIHGADLADATPLIARTPKQPVIARTPELEPLSPSEEASRNPFPEGGILRLSPRQAESTFPSQENVSTAGDGEVRGGFRSIEMTLHDDKPPKAVEKQQADPKHHVPDAPSKHPVRSAVQSTQAVQPRLDTPEAPKYEPSGRLATQPAPGKTIPNDTRPKIATREAPLHQGLDGLAEENRFSDPRKAPMPTNLPSQTLASPMVAAEPISDPNTFLHVAQPTPQPTAGFAPWQHHSAGNTSRPSLPVYQGGSPPISFTVMSTGETVTLPRMGGGAAPVQAMAAVNESPILPASRPTQAKLNLKKALVYSHQGLYQEALTELQKARALAPDEAAIYAAEGEIYLKLKNMPRAKDAYQKANQLAPDELFNERYAIVLYHTGDRPQATHVLENLVQLNPNQADAQLMLGTLYQEAGRYDDALNHLKTAVSLSPKSADAHFNLALSWETTGNKDLAERHYKQALLLSSTSAQRREVEQALARLKQGHG